VNSGHFILWNYYEGYVKDTSRFSAAATRAY
jgi:hypothetical protein